MDGQRGLLATSFKVDKEPESCVSAGRCASLDANAVCAGIATGSHTDDGATKFKTTTVFGWDSETFSHRKSLSRAKKRTVSSVCQRIVFRGRSVLKADRTVRKLSGGSVALWRRDDACQQWRSSVLDGCSVVLPKFSAELRSEAEA